MTLVLDESQERAVSAAMTAQFMVISGGPGVGKTTTLRALLDRLDAARTQDPTSPSYYDAPEYLLASPTGKAARRLSEATGRPARTIHRLLGYHPLQGWRHNRLEPIEAKLVVVDEASMLDTELAGALLDAIDPGTTRLLLVGDADQLPSVGPGRVFGDLIDSGRIPVARLTTLHRAAQESWICRNAPVVLRGQVPELLAPAAGDFRWVEENAVDRLTERVVALVTREIPAMAKGLPVTSADIQVLSPQRTGVAGVDALNAALQRAINPRDPRAAWETGSGDDGTGPHARGAIARMAIGDRVIQTHNDYTLGVMNGETGTVLSFDKSPTPDGKSQEMMLVQFEGHERPVGFNRYAAKDLRLAYALTVHKSQGSEFAWVVVIAHTTHTRMLSRQILYTAITRAKRGVVIVGDAEALKRAVRNDKPARRNTTLVERLRAGLPALELASSAPSPGPSPDAPVSP